MKIKVEFLNGSEFWKNKILDSAIRASEVMSSEAFSEKVKSWTAFYFTSLSPREVEAVLHDTSEITIKVGFYSKWLTRAIAYEADGCVYFNTRKLNYGAGSSGNVAHEVMHALGFSHDGNSASGNENTVPYRIGEWVDGWGS